MNTDTLATIFQTGGRLVSTLLQTYGVKRNLPPGPGKGLSKVEAPEDSKRVTTKETVDYQRRELAKELTLLEGHLLQGCKINGKACDCCEKHPIKIEGLALETAGMVPTPVYKELANWVQSISPMTSEASAASGKYEGEYPKLAIQARNFRKAIMGSDLMKEVKDEAKPTEN